MALPIYDTDLTEIDLAEDDADYDALGGGGAGLSADLDFAIQGTYSVTKQVSNSRKGVVFNNGTTISIPAGDHIYVWIYCTTPGLLETLAVGGLCVTIGDGTSARNEFHIVGAAEYSQGGWLCIPIKYVTTANGSHPYRTLVGSPSGDPQYFGVIVETTALVKAVNTSVDAMRYGTGAYIIDGEVANPATFGGFAADNDDSNERWGILSAIAGGFALQGRFVVGQDTSKSPTAAYFDDSNTLVVLTDTFHSETDFTQLIVDHADTTFNMTSVTILALGIINPGRLVFNNALTTSALTTCIFDSIDITILRAGVTATGCTWRSTGQVTQNGATITGCVFDNSTALIALLVANAVASVTETEFISDGTGYAMEGFSTAGDYNLTDLTFTGYAVSDGITGNEAIHILATTGTVNLVRTGGTLPSIHTEGATVEFPTSIQLTIVVKNEAGDPIVGASAYIDNNDESPYILNTTTDGDGEATIAYSGNPITGSRWRVRLYGYKPFAQNIDTGTEDITLPVTLVADPLQS